MAEISSAQAILEALIRQAGHQLSLAWGFKKNLETLRDRLTMIQALLSEADRRRSAISEPLKAWLKTLDDVTSKAENLLDELKYEANRKESEAGNRLRNKVRDFVSVKNNPVGFRVKMASKFNDINLLLDDVYKRGAAEIGLNQASHVLETSGVEPMDFSLTAPYMDDRAVVGRKDDVSKVLEMLLNSNVEDVIAIVGTAGLGKTTLARLVYKHEEVVSNFDGGRMWVCVSDDFEVERVLNEMVESLTATKSDLRNVEAIVQKLGEKLNGKKYLLVLDDVWNRSESKWQRMRDSLLGIGASKGSKIIVTTRSMDVVSTMQEVSPCLTHRLQGLSPEASLTMFKKKIFANRGPIETHSLLSIGERMVWKCEGVPLAINALGGILRSKKYESDWLNVEKSIWSSLGDSNDILPILRLSFDDLPSPSLKHCFAYCSVFPKDKIIIKDELIQLWMALGYLQPPLGTNLEAEDVGNEYFDVLLRRSLFQEWEFDEYRNITSCIMHDFVHDLALTLSEGNCLTLEASKVKDYPKVKHLSVCLEEGTRLEISKENVQKLRTLFLTGHLPINSEDVTCMRALSIVKFGAKGLPDSISKFIYLKYLDLSKSSTKKVPDFITKLYNLETLRLPHVVEFPKEFHKLVSLRHLCMGDSKVVPALIGDLTSLRTLNFFVVGKDKGHKIEELRSLSNLRGKLKIYNLQYVKKSEEAKTANMMGKKDVHELVYHWANEGIEQSHVYHQEVLEELQPHTNLRGLILEYFGGQRFASWMVNRNAGSLINLVEIKLKDCRLCEQVPTLGHLPHLEVVEMDGLHNVKCIGFEFYGLNEGNNINSSSNWVAARGPVFPALRMLTLDNMLKLEEWSDVSSSVTSMMEFFPRLEKLSILKCPQLITIPGNLLSLQRIMISSSSLFLDGVERTYNTSSSSLFLDGVEMMYNTSLNILVDQGSENILILFEGLLEKSSKSLRSLAIWGLDKLCDIPTQLLNLRFLEKLEIDDCSNLRSFFKDAEAGVLGRLKSLKQLCISSCPELICLPKELLQPTLDTLELTCCRRLIMTHSDELRSLTSLQNLTIKVCPGLAKSWGEGLFCLGSLRNLVIGGFSLTLKHFPWPSTSADAANVEVVQRCPFLSLESLCLWGGSKHLPDQLQHLIALKKLEIDSFEELEALPEWLGNLSSLQSLGLLSCPNLMSLPSLEAIQRLTNLRNMIVFNCPLLKKACESGEEGLKIAHIPPARMQVW